MSALERGDGVDVITNTRLTGTARTDPFGQSTVDVFLVDGHVADIAPAGALPIRGRVLDADGAWVIPGLWDNHVHTVQWAMVAQRTPLADVTSAAGAIARMAASPILGDGRRVGTGFRDALWPDAPSLSALDAATGEIPTYMINSDVHSVWLNSAALRREGFVSDDGVLREEPAFEVSRRLNAADPAVADSLVAAALDRAAARGIVGIVDMDMAWNAEAWRRRLAAGFASTRISFGVYADLLPRAIDEGLFTGFALDDAGLVRMGPLKVISDGSLGTRTAACSHPYPDPPGGFGALTVPPERLVELMTAATAAGIHCAIHAIGDIANSYSLEAYAATGAQGRIEHAQLVAAADIGRFARLGVGVSVQPEHAIDDRDMTDTIWASQTALPYPFRSLADAGANLLFGSDAPVAALDPWAAMASGIFRTRDGRPAWQPEQAVDAGTALAASTAGGSATGNTVEPGDVADLVLVDRDPLSVGELELRATEVQATMIEARLTFR